MKTFTKPGLILAFVLFGLPSYASTIAATLPVEATTQTEANRVTNRLEEIKAMDKSTLTVREKRALKHELKEMKRAQRAPTPDDDDGGSGGVYLSVGAIIIIILLLIILL